MIAACLRWLVYRLRGAVLRARGVFYCWSIRLLNGSCIGPITVGAGFVFKHPPHSGIVFGRNISIGKNVLIDVPIGATLRLGDNVKLNMDIVIAASSYIEIGNDTQIAEFVSVRDSDHGTALGLTISQQQLISEPVFIGRDVWIGRGVAILKGSLIEDGAVIGANSVVNGRILKNIIAVGAPAKSVKLRQVNKS